MRACILCEFPCASHFNFYGNFRFKREAEREAVIEVMDVFFPILQNRCVSLIKDDSSEAAVLIFKIFKIFHGLIQVQWLTSLFCFKVYSAC